MILSEGSLAFIYTYKYLGAFLGSIFFAESVILGIFFLSGRGLMDPFLSFGIIFIGSIISDLFWFFFGVHFLKLTRQWDLEKKIIHLMKVLDERLEKNILLSLFCIKLAYGTRFLTVAYLAFRKTEFRKFIINDLIATVMWLTILFAIGWSAGNGAFNLIPYYMKFQYIVFGIVALMIVYTLLAKLFMKYIKTQYGKR